MADKRAYGYIPSTPDERDYAYSIAPREGYTLPAGADLRPHLVSPIRDQGQLGACTGFALTSLREHLALRHSEPLTPLSPLYLYYEERKIEGTIDEDAGAMPRDGLKTLLHIGCAPEVDEPYNPRLFTSAPSPMQDEAAAAWKITSYHRLHTLDDIKLAIAHQSTGVVMGFAAYQGLEDVDSTGVLTMPHKGEQPIGGHCVFVVGYMDNKDWQGGGYLIIKNSWGEGWGLGGYFLMPYAYVTKSRVSDLWTAVL